MNTMYPIHRQGDVYFQKLDTAPVKGDPQKEVTVAYGEVTGHHHTIYSVDKETKISATVDGEYTIVEVVNGMAGLFHGSTEQIQTVRDGKTLDWTVADAHAPQMLEPGMYRFWTQSEYDVLEYRRKVLD